LVNKYSEYSIYNLYSLTFSVILENLNDIEAKENYTFLQGDITDEKYINSIFNTYKFDAIIHLAAESHVDRSIADPLIFAKTNIIGTINLLNAFNSLWKNNWQGKRFYHISTDEVYGSLGESGLFEETSLFQSKFALCSFQGQLRSFCECLRRNLWIAIRNFELFKQLWTLSIS